MPLNPSGGGGATLPSTYYGTPTIIGNYQFISLEEIINNFIAAYVGEGKILSTVLAGDVKFHAHRALQELSYDTLKSCKSQEIEVCPSLKMPLPHDYVNYVKLTSVDANGIEHPLYPNRNTSNPFAIEQNNCEYEFNTDGTIKHQETCEDATETTCDATTVNGFINWYINWSEYTDTWPVNPIIAETIYDGSIQIADGDEGNAIATALIDSHCNCLASASHISEAPNCGTCNGKGGDNGEGGPCWSEYNQYRVEGVWNFPSYGPFTTGGSCTPSSNAWDNFSSNSSNTTIGNITVDPTVDSTGYFDYAGKRYGLETSLANANGTYFMDCLRGNIHFSSDLSGKTIILKYISDGHGTPEEEIVPKLAEEAMYKWIAYGCVSARTDYPEYLVARFKKEKASETRKAKIRLSNIKIEEISQVFRGKSNWIKH